MVGGDILFNKEQYNFYDMLYSIIYFVYLICFRYFVYLYNVEGHIPVRIVAAVLRELLVRSDNINALPPAQTGTSALAGAATGKAAVAKHMAPTVELFETVTFANGVLACWLIQG